jgi:hypothetical protein
VKLYGSWSSPLSRWRLIDQDAHRSIVNGLRDDDAESFYGNRTSFLSEYSMRETGNDGVQVFFKEHSRKVSKDSGDSYVSRRKTQQSPKRPETKVKISNHFITNNLNFVFLRCSSAPQPK